MRLAIREVWDGREHLGVTDVYAAFEAMGMDVLTCFNVGGGVPDGVAVFYDVFTCFNVAKGIFVPVGQVNIYVIKTVNFHYFIFSIISSVRNERSASQSFSFAKISRTDALFINSHTAGSSLGISVL